MARKSTVQKRAFPEEPIVQWKAGVYTCVSVSDNREHGESILDQLNFNNFRKRILFCNI